MVRIRFRIGELIMIGIIKPYYGAMSERLLFDVFEKNGKYYVIDRFGSKFETTKEEYDKCKEILNK